MSMSYLWLNFSDRGFYFLNQYVVLFIWLLPFVLLSSKERVLRMEIKFKVKQGSFFNQKKVLKTIEIAWKAI